MNKSLDEIHPWLKNIYFKYPFSFIVQVLIFQTWMSFNNDGQYDYKRKYDDGTKIVFKI
jgi:hypothetical protein